MDNREDEVLDFQREECKDFYGVRSKLNNLKLGDTTGANREALNIMGALNDRLHDVEEILFGRTTET